MSYYQYISVHHNLIPDELMNEYNLHIEPDDHMYFEICHGMYGLEEAGIISFGHIVEKLSPHG